MKLKITTHSDDDEDIVEVDSFDADAMAKKRNDNDIEAIAIGGYVYSRIDLKNIKPFRGVDPVDNEDEQT